MNQPADTRKARRHPCHGPIQVRLQDWYPFKGRIINLCLEGCLIEPNQQTGYVVGDRLNLRFTVNHLSFLVQCIVRRVTPKGALGVEILLLSDRSRKQLGELIEEFESPHS